MEARNAARERRKGILLRDPARAGEEESVEERHPVSLSRFGGSEKRSGGLAQLVERLPCKQEVSGSNPLISTGKGLLAQLVRALA